jgi:aryl-alcohol dehydrogenase-like predicted oxidoreductase
MEKRALGATNIQITPVGLGCWQFSDGKALTGTYWPKLGQDLTNAIVQASLAGGINWFDTAEAYGWGASEAGLAKALYANGEQPGSVRVATKWFPLGRFAGSITRTIDKRLAYLDGFPIDLHQIHAPYGSFSRIERQMDAMAELVADKKIGAIGVSNFNTKQLRRAYDHLAKKGIPLASNQIQYNLLQRQAEKNGVIDLAKALGISIIAYSPLAQGLLTGKFHDDPTLIKGRVGPRKRMGAFSPKGMAKSAPMITALKDIAEKHGVTPGQVALRWLLQRHGETVVVIPGATKVRHAQQNAAVLGFALTDENMETIRKVIVS